MRAVLGLPLRIEELFRLFVAEEVAATLRHGFVNRLTGIGNASFSLRRRLEGEGAPHLDPETLELLGEIKLQLAQAAEQVPLRRLPPRPEGAIAVAHVVSSFVASLALPPGIRLVADTASARLAAVTPGELEVALFCLIENGFDAGATTIRVRCSGVAVEVIDDGPGIPAEMQERALEPFFTSKPGRVGIGLNIARRIAGRWGGRLELGRASPSGLRAVLLLPEN